MKLNDSDSTNQYKATSRLGNPDTAAPGDAKELRQNMHDTTNVINKLWEMNPQLKERARKEMLDGFADTLVNAEDIFNEKEITQVLIEAIQEQRYFHKAKENFYSNLLTTIKFEINDI